MRRAAFSIFLTIAAFASCVMLQDVLAGGSDTLSVLVTVVDAPPQGTIVINNGDTNTSSVSVTLTLSATDTESSVDQMCFSNDGTTWSTPDPFATEKSWSLSDGDGEKTVCVKFRDSAGHWSGDFSDTITLNMLVTSTITYTYDDLNQLQNMAYGTVNAAYRYDEVGNITNKNTTGN